MRIAILGYGSEGQAAEAYFKQKGNTCEVFDQLDRPALEALDLSAFDLILRSPSIPPVDKTWSSLTNYFFDHCPAPIIGVTGTKGKGTTCSLIAALLTALGQTVHLLGNIGKPAIGALDKIKENDVVVYELSSFQLWNLQKSPHIAVVLRIEPDHLNVHSDFDDYLGAKANIAAHQSPDDALIYYQDNTSTAAVAAQSPARKFPYPAKDHRASLDAILDHLAIPGAHNRENAEAALLAVAAHLGLDPAELLASHAAEIEATFKTFENLPHRLQFVGEYDGVAYYDDSYSSAFPALDVALATFKDHPLILIAGGKDRGLDLSETKSRIFGAKNLKKAILIGETKEQLAKGQDPSKYLLAATLKEAVGIAREIAESYAEDAAAKAQHSVGASDRAPIVLFSPGAASFDMFKDFEDRGRQYQKLIKEQYGQ